VRLNDTFTRSLVELPPPPAEIGMYVCGPTVYDRAHVGNARPFVLFSWLARWLRERGHGVTYVHNVTDVNDKIYKAAPGRSADRAREATAWYVEDTRDLGLGMPDAMPLATATVDEIVALIGELVESGHAYQAGGDVYFRVAAFPGYGELSRQRLDQVEGQVEDEEPNALKEDPRDFALWKGHKPDEDTWWDSPWGRGRPGWHIECSAMAEKYLGPVFWIHGGGLDLVFPHHENERAQSQAAGRPFAKVWMHNGMLRFVGEKMSKSLGNVASLRDVLDEWGRETLLLFFLTAHWGKPIDFSRETMEAARAQWTDFVGVVYDPPAARPASQWAAFADALEDDFNTPDALAVLHEWRAAGQIDLMQRGLRVFGLEIARVEPPADVHSLLTARDAAREARDFEAADLQRAKIEERGWVVRDKPGGSVLVPKP
jgi:cysteinyl-tRNA synthetase